MEETGGNIDLAGKNFCLIDFSYENDCLIASDASSSTPTDYPSPETMGEPRSFELTGDFGANEVDIVALTNGQSEQMPQLLETSEPERLRKTGKCNLRKSLAWDSAFFESPGVLDAEELSSMIEGAEKGKKHLLPGIEEDISTSTESISTLLSENLTVESLEDTLFEDIRASIQKSSKASNMANSNCKTASTETDNQVNCSAKKVDLASRKSIMTNAASKKKTVGMQGYGRMINQGSCYPQVTQPVLQNGNSTSSLARLPKVLSRPGPISNITTKRASLGVNCDKTETDNAKVGGKGTQVSKSTGLAGRRAVPKPALSSKASSSASFGAIKEATKSSSSCDSSSSSLSSNIRESPSTSASRKPETMHVIHPSSGSIPKASSKVSLKKKPSDNSGNSTYLTSSKISPTISPANSIDECSSASSSTSGVNQRSSKPSASVDTSSSCRSLDNDTPPVLCMDVQSNDHISDGIVNQVTGLLCQDIKKGSMQTGELSQSALKKPSGLRMPSPKIGFFDGAKSVVCTSTGNMESQSHLPTCFPEMGAGICSPVGSSKKARDGKLPPGTKKVSGAFRGVKSNTTTSDAQNETGTISCSSPVWSSNKAVEKLQPGITVIRGTNTKTDGQKSASSKPFQEALSASSSISPEDQDEKGEVSCLEAEDLRTGKPDRVEHDTVPAPEREKDENLGDSKNSVNLLMQGNAEIDEIKTAVICDSSTDNYIEYLKPSQEVGEGELYGEHHSNDGLLNMTNVKQNGHLKDLVDGLSRNMGALDIQVEMQKELTDSINSQSEVSYLDCGALELCSKKHFLPDQKEVSVNDLLTSCTRTPFAANDSLYNIEGVDFSIGTEVVVKTNILTSSEIVQIENS